MASRSTNTQAEALQGLIKSVAEIKMMPDADLPFLIGLETMILQYLRKPLDDMAGQLPPQGGGQMQTGIMGGQPDPMMAMGAGGGAPGGMAPPMAGAGGPAGIGMRPAAPNPDELRRMLAPTA